jgi:hypothetical protein
MHVVSLFLYDANNCMMLCMILMWFHYSFHWNNCMMLMWLHADWKLEPIHSKYEIEIIMFESPLMLPREGGVNRRF